MFEERIAALEGAEDAFATASGMAAVNSSLMSMLRAGDHVVSSRALFGSVPLHSRGGAEGGVEVYRYGVEVTFVDGTDLDQWRTARAGRTRRRVFLETVANPTLEVIDLEAVGGHRPRGRGLR